MIDQLGNGVVALDAAQREDLELLRHQRKATAQAFASRLTDLVDFIAALRTDAAAQDADFTKAIARREAMLGEPQSFKMAAE